MILLEYHNKIIEGTLLEKFNNANPNNNDGEAKFDAIEAVFADFDGVTFHMFSDQTNKSILRISMNMKSWAEIAANGVDAVLKNIYGPMLVAPEQGYNVTLQVDLAKPPADVAKVCHDIALLKRNALAAPFYKVFADVEQKKPGQMIEIKYRDDEAIFIKPESDRVIVIFSISFKDQDDVVLAKVFLQEYADGKKNLPGLSIPSVTYSQKEPPAELKGVRNLRVGEGQGFVSFVLFANHINGPKKEKTIDNIQTFRNYLHYHIKCSKGFIHTRMRTKVDSFLQVLNRARSTPQSTEKKTITGKTFSRTDDH
jgi:actin related protein 2/3 complex subunit 2